MSSPKRPEFKYGPFEQAITVLVVMGFAANPSIPSSFYQTSPLSPLIMLTGIAYLGYYLLRRQEYARARASALKPKSSQSSSDPRGSGLDPRNDPSSNLFRKNYFLTMQDGLRPKKGQAEGTLWWENVSDDTKDLMAPPLDPDKMKVKNPWSAAMLEKEVELLKLAKKQKEEGEKFEKVGNLLHTLLGLLLCLVDMRLGLVAAVFFLWRHFAAASAADEADLKVEVEKEKEDLVKQIREAKKSATDQQLLASLQEQLARL